ncbi:MAG: DNA polymerase [Eubacteriales bacterium]|nr:DNA polymerase [Eubacteriales bacterium]
MHLSIDIETYSDIDIKKAGLYRYAQSPSFEVLLFAYGVNASPVCVIDLAQGETIPQEIMAMLLNPAAVKHSYNASFEWFCLSKHLGLSDAISIDWLSQWQCTMLHGLYCGYTAGLSATGEALGLPIDKRKLGVGSSLIRTFCVPQKPVKSNGNRTRTLPHHEPEKWQLFKSYCAQDVVTEMEIERLLSAFPVPEEEQRLWQLDQRINARGVRVDTQLVDSALAIDEAATKELTAEAIMLSGLSNPKSVQQLTKWLEEEIDEEVPDLRKETVKDLLKGELESDAARRVLEIRQQLSKTSTKKYAAMRVAVCDDSRVRGLLQFYGANRTGRWAGRLVQVQNLPQNHLPALGFARELVDGRNTTALQLLYGSVPDTLSQLIRTAFIPSERNVFVVADFSAIEARVISWLAGEQWRMDVFATHGKIYEASAAQMFGVPLEEITKDSPLRQRGKVAELALGYQGGVGALVKMDTAKKLDPNELPEIVQRWRSANRRIVDLWYAIENAALTTMQTGRPSGARGILFAREGDYATGQDFLTITLPSGRKLYYVRPFLAPNQWGNDSLHYYGMDQTTKKWSAVETYGGKLVENIVQATARDCLAVAMQRLDALGLPITMHVHDEVIIDAPPDTSLETVCAVMGEPIPWAPGLLLKADGFVSDFYMKN